MLLDSGQIVGMLMRYSVDDWQDFLEEVRADKQFRYSVQVQLLVELREALAR